MRQLLGGGFRGLAQGLRELEPGLARHHHVEHHKVIAQALQLGARIGGINRRGDDEIMLRQIAAQQRAQPVVVIDHQDMGLERQGLRTAACEDYRRLNAVRGFY